MGSLRALDHDRNHLIPSPVQAAREDGPLADAAQQGGILDGVALADRLAEVVQELGVVEGDGSSAWRVVMYDLGCGNRIAVDALDFPLPKKSGNSSG